MQRIPRKSLPYLMSFALALAAPALLADPAIRLNGDRLCVSVPSAHIGSRLMLLWDDADKGDDPAAWANSHVIAPVVTEADSCYTVDLYSLGITNGLQLCVAVIEQFKLLDKLEMANSTAYINTGLKDTEVYGVRFGFYGNSGNHSDGWNYIIGSGEGSNTGRGFVVGQNNTSFGSWFWTYNGYRSGTRPSVNTGSFNEAAFVDRKFMLNGTWVGNLTLAQGSVGVLGWDIYLGCALDGSGNLALRRHYGWWSHVSFDDANGRRILDYIPVQRYSDNKVGFFDRATTNFVVSTGGGALNAGTVTNDWFSGGVTMCRVARNPENEMDITLTGSRLRIDVPSSFAGDSLMIAWDNTNKGDDIGAWANTSVIAAVIGADGGTWTVRLSELGIQNRQVCGVIAGHRLRLLDMLKMPNTTTYVNTGVKDSDVYGVRFGFYGNESHGNNNQYCNIIGTYDKDNSPVGSGFTVGMNSSNYSSWYWSYGTYKSPGEYRPSNVRTDAINDVAFTNQVFTLNGQLVKGVLPDGPVGGSGANMFLGTWAAGSRYLFGWWSYARFDDADGNAILDYIPAQRVTDDKVGFYDRATGKFVSSTGTGDFTVGAVTNALSTFVHSRHTFMRIIDPTTLYIR